MKYFPININLKNKNCLIVGGGEIAFRKAKTLLSCEAKVKLVSPRISPGIKQLKKNDRFQYHKRRYLVKDLNNIFLAMIATNDRKINAKISKDAKKRKILVNVVDSPDLCDFIVPAIAKYKNLTISICTNGISPALSKYIRKEVEKKYKGYANLLGLLQCYRNKIIKLNERRKRAIWKSIINESFLKKVKNATRKEIYRLLIEKIKN